jgi:hypothetical protein
VLEPQEEGGWADWIEVDGDRRIRAKVEIEGDELVLSTNSEARFERIRTTVANAVKGLELLDERRTPPGGLARLSRAGISARKAPARASSRVRSRGSPRI